MTSLLLITLGLAAVVAVLVVLIAATGGPLTLPEDRHRTRRTDR